MQPDPHAEARAVLESLERRLLDETPKRLDFVVESDGALIVRLRGRLRRGGPGVVAIDARGLFAERDVDLMLRADADSMTGGVGAHFFTREAPPELDEAVMLGFTRMGILHNLAMLAGGRPPDRADGGVREWLTVTDVKFADDPDPEVHVLTFNIVVDGRETATASLWIDRATMRPLRRTQRVNFPGGFMDVVETYDHDR